MRIGGLNFLRTNDGFFSNLVAIVLVLQQYSLYVLNRFVFEPYQDLLNQVRSNVKTNKRRKNLCYFKDSWYLQFSKCRSCNFFQLWAQWWLSLKMIDWFPGHGIKTPVRQNCVCVEFVPFLALPWKYSEPTKSFLLYARDSRYYFTTNLIHTPQQFHSDRWHIILPLFLWRGGFTRILYWCDAVKFCQSIK